MNHEPLSEAQDEISLRDIIDFVADHWRNAALGGLAAGVLAGAYAFLAPADYRATATIQVAKVANIEVEPPNVLLEKLKLPQYFSATTHTACDVADDEQPGLRIAKAIKPMSTKNTPFVSISFLGKSPGAAKKCIESILSDINSNQSEIAKPILATKKNQLGNLKLKMESAERLVNLLPSSKSNPASVFEFSDSKFSAAALLLATVISKENEIKDLRTQINDLEIALSEPQTKGAYLATPIDAPNVPAGRSPLLIILLASFVGVALTGMVLLARKALAKA